MLTSFKKITISVATAAIVGGMLFAVGQLEKPYIDPFAEVTTSKLRIWLNRSTWENSGAVIKIEYGSSVPGGTLANPDGYVENSSLNVWYAYYDVPITIVGNKYRFRRFGPDGADWTGVTPVYNFVEDDNNKMFYLTPTNNDYATVSQGKVDKAHVNFLKYVLEGYMTCSSSKSNGYNAYPTLNSNFIHDGVNWLTVGELSSVIVNDYKSIGDYAIGKGGTPATVDGWTKLQAMRINYEAK